MVGCLLFFLFIEISDTIKYLRTLLETTKFLDQYQYSLKFSSIEQAIYGNAGRKLYQLYIIIILY